MALSKNKKFDSKKEGKREREKKKTIKAYRIRFYCCCCYEVSTVY